MPEPQLNQLDTGKIAGIAKIASSEKRKTFQDVISESNQTAKSPQDKALRVLQTLHAQHVANLEAGGHSGKGALVRRDNYWKALRKAHLDPDTACDLLDQGRVRIQAEGLYWIPQAAPASLKPRTTAGLLSANPLTREESR